MFDLGIEAISGADDSDFGVGIEEVKDAACCYLNCVSMSILCARDPGDKRWTHFAAADDQDFLVADLPGEDQRPPALHLRELLAHIDLGYYAGEI